MGEPNSIMAEMLQLCLLAGSRTEKDANGQTRQVPALEPGRIQPAAWADSALWPGAGTVTIFNNHPIPAGQMFIATYVSLCTSLQDQSSLTINFGMVGSASIAVYSNLNGADTVIYYSIPWQSVFNTPVFIPFPATAKPKFVLGSAGGVVPVGSVTVDVKMSGYLLDVSYWNTLKKYQTQVQFD